MVKTNVRGLLVPKLNSFADLKVDELVWSARLSANGIAIRARATQGEPDDSAVSSGMPHLSGQQVINRPRQHHDNHLLNIFVGTRASMVVCVFSKQV